MTIHYETETTAPRTEANYQYYGINHELQEGRDWYYNNSLEDKTRTIGWIYYTLHEIRFTVVTSQIDDLYAYCLETGQIFFAGKNTPYYGYTNINDMPQA